MRVVTSGRPIAGRLLAGKGLAALVLLTGLLPATAEAPPGRDRYVAACSAALTRPTPEQARRFCRCLWRFAVEMEPAGLDPDITARLLMDSTRRPPPAPQAGRPQVYRKVEEHLAIVSAVCTEAAVLNILDAEGHPSD